MNTKVSYRLFFLIGSFLLLTNMAWSQHETDSILEFATSQIYENPNVAIETAQEILNSPEATTDTKVLALIVTSQAYSSKREYEKSLESSRRAMEMFPKISDKELKIKLLNRIGGQYQELNVYDKALTYLDEAYQLLKTFPESPERLKLLGFNNLVRGFIYREQMSCEIALDYFNSSIEAYKKIETLPNISSNLSIAFYNKGNCLLSLDKTSEAKASFLQAITYAQKNNAKSLVAFAKKGLAGFYTSVGDSEKAINLLTEALQNSEEVGDKILNRSIYDALANNYLVENDLKNYSLYKDKNLAVHNEITQTERKTIDNSIQNNMEVNAKKLDDLQTKNYLFRALLLLLIIVVIILIARSFSASEKTLKVLKKELKL